MSRFSTAHLQNKFTFGNKHNNPVNNELLWRASVARDNKWRKLSADEAKTPHVEVNPFRGLLGRHAGAAAAAAATAAAAAAAVAAAAPAAPAAAAAAEDTANKVTAREQVVSKLRDLDILLRTESERSRKLDRQLTATLESSEVRFADLVEEHQRPRASSASVRPNARRRLNLKLPRTKPSSMDPGPSSGQVSLKNRQVRSHNLMNYTF